MSNDISRTRPPPLTYGFAICSVAIVVVLKQFVIPPIGRDAPFLLMFVPVLFSAWFGGVWPGIVAAVLGTLAVHYFFLPPYYDLRGDPVATIHSVVFGVMSIISAVLMGTIQTARRRAEIAARRIEGIYAVGVALGGTRSVQEIADVILHEGVAVLGADKVALYAVSDEGDTLRLLTHLGRDTRLLKVASSQPFREVPMNVDTPITLAARTRTVMYLESEEEYQKRFPERFEVAEKIENGPIRGALICAPMIVHGHVVGVLAIVFAKSRRIRPEDRSWVQALAQDCGMAVERTRLFERERHARMEAQDSARAKDQFLAVVSNELRAPLTTIIGWAHMLKRQKPDDRPRYRHGLDVIERSAQAQARLVDDILDMSRIGARSLKLEAKSLELSRLIRGVVSELEVKAAAKGLHVSVDLECEATVMADPERMRQVMCNVLSSAFSYTPPGGRVFVEMENKDGRVFVRVCDTGRGFDGDQLHHALEAFHVKRDPGGRRQRGLGLGLAIADYIVREHHGALRIESPGRGRGATFTIELPLAEPTAGVLAVNGRRPGDRTPLDGIRVLVVDDDTDSREALTEMLSAEGAEVRPAPSAQVALEEIGSFEPSVIVSNLDMRDRDGEWFIREVRALRPPLGTVPALALTPRSRAADSDTAIAAGYQRQLAKPPDPRQLTKQIAELGAVRP